MKKVALRIKNLGMFWKYWIVELRVVKSNYKVKGGDQVKVLFTHPPYENLLVGDEDEVAVAPSAPLLAVATASAMRSIAVLDERHSHVGRHIEILRCGTRSKGTAKRKTSAQHFATRFT